MGRPLGEQRFQQGAGGRVAAAQSGKPCSSSLSDRYRHITLALLAHAFLAVTRAQASGTELAKGDAAA